MERRGIGDDGAVNLDDRHRCAGGSVAAPRKAVGRIDERFLRVEARRAGNDCWCAMKLSDVSVENIRSPSVKLLAKFQ